MSPQTRHSDTDQQHPLPWRHRAVAPASQQLLPSLLKGMLTPSLPSVVAQPTLSAVPWVRLHPPCPTERAAGTPLPPASILVHPTPHPTNTMPSLSPAQMGPAVCKGWKAWASTAQGCSVPVQHQKQHRAYDAFVFLSLSIKVFPYFHATQLSYQPLLLTLILAMSLLSPVVKYS